MAICTITGTLRDLTGVPLPSTLITFVRDGVTGQDGSTIIPKVVSVTSNGSGVITVGLYSGNYTATVAMILTTFTFSVAVPGDVTAVLSDLINSAATVITPQALTDAQAARDAAQAAEVQTGLDAIATAADRVQTGLDVVSTGADRTATNADAVATAADRVQTGLDVVATGADRTATNTDAVATAADRVQTGLDVVSTGADRTATNTDAVATAADRVQTGLDVVSTGADRTATNADATATGADKTATNADAAATAADRVQTGLDATAATVAKMNWSGAWATATAYVLHDVVEFGGASFICVAPHTSGVWATDLAAVKWQLVAQRGSPGAGSGDMLGANNLGDVVSAATARANLGLTIGTTVQAEISGAVVGAVPVAGLDKVLIQDTSASDELKTVTAKSIGEIGRVVLQRVTYTTAAVQYNTSGTGIPSDDTLHQKTEGNLYYSQSITPASAASTLVVEVEAHLATSASGWWITGSIFLDTGADALSTTNIPYTTNDAPYLIRIRYEMAAGSTTAKTFKFIAGGSSGASPNMTLNGAGGTRRFGGSLISSMTITEYA